MNKETGFILGNVIKTRSAHAQALAQKNKKKGVGMKARGY